MQSIQKLTINAAVVTLLCCSFSSPAAEAEEALAHKAVIALKTNEFELQETDISGLAVGESKTLVTDSGRTVDLLRTETGMEVYVDGVLLDTGDHGTTEHPNLHQRVELTCTAEDACEKHVWIETGEPGADSEQLVERTVEVMCDDEDECEHVMVWVGEKGEEHVELEALEGDAKGFILQQDSPHTAGENKVIVIKHKEDQP